MSVNKQMRILVVDDFPTMRAIITKILRSLGFSKIMVAENGLHAWEMLERYEVDLIISDWSMPQMSGLELLQKVRNDPQYKDVPFLMVTAEAKQQNIIEAMQHKVSHYIVKPFTAETLWQKICETFTT